MPGAHRELLPAEPCGGFGCEVFGGGEPASFVELLVVGQIGLAHEGFDLSALHHGGAVDQRTSHLHGQANHDDDVQPAAEFQQLQHGALGFLQQGLLMEEVLTGVARHRELGEDDHLRAFAFGLCGQGFDALNVPQGCRHLHAGHGCGDSDKSVIHIVRSVCYRCKYTFFF